MIELILVRGLPGSGKSTLADHLCRGDYYYAKHFEADMYHYDSGVYNWKPERVAYAHRQCLEDARAHLVENIDWMEGYPEYSVVSIVSNTFTRMWEMMPYLRMAKELGAKVTVLTCEGNYGNVHGVPEDTINKMRARWEPYVPLEAE